MISLRGELMRITFEVQEYSTVQEYMRTIAKILGKLHIFMQFKECFNQKIEIYPFSKWQLSEFFQNINQNASIVACFQKFPEAKYPIASV